MVNYGTRVPPKVSTLTFAHEVGHNFGSPVCYSLTTASEVAAVEINISFMLDYFELDNLFVANSAAEYISELLTHNLYALFISYSMTVAAVYQHRLIQMTQMGTTSCLPVRPVVTMPTTTSSHRAPYTT